MQIEALLAEGLVSAKGDEGAKGEAAAGVESFAAKEEGAFKTALPPSPLASAVRQLSAALLTCLSQCELLLPASVHALKASSSDAPEDTQDTRRRARLLGVGRLAVVALDRLAKLERRIQKMNNEGAPLVSRQRLRAPAVRACVCTYTPPAKHVAGPCCLAIFLQLLSTSLFLPPERAAAVAASSESLCRRLSIQRAESFCQESLRCTVHSEWGGASSGGSASLGWTAELRRLNEEPIEEVLRLEAAVRHEVRSLAGGRPRSLLAGSQAGASDGGGGVVVAVCSARRCLCSTSRWLLRLSPAQRPPPKAAGPRLPLARRS